MILHAQVPENAGNRNRPAMKGRLYGKVVDVNNKGIEFAAVQLSQVITDPKTETTSEKLISGQLTAGNGDFTLIDIPITKGNYILRVNAIGFNTVEQMINLNLSASGERDLGNIKLKPSSVQIAEAVIVGETPAYEMRIDKKVYDVEKNPVGMGGTAEDVLKNVPSLNVDIDGNLTLRNSSPQLFIDGRPSTLTIDQIPADAIQSIEVITNPSAKYDASGGMAGIVNIVLKKNRRMGYNGSVRTGIDTRGRINLGGDINSREGKINVFMGANLNQRRSNSTGATDRTNFSDIPNTQLSQSNSGKTNGYFGSIRGGVDYFIDNRNTLSLSGSYHRGTFDSNNEILTHSDSLYTTGTERGIQERLSESGRMFENTGAALSFKHLYPREGKELSADINYNQSTSSNDGFFRTSSFDENDNQIGNMAQQLQEGTGANNIFTIQSDYAVPVSDKSKIETGIRFSNRNYSSTNNNFLFDEQSNSYQFIPGQSNEYAFTDRVMAAYLTYSRQINKFGFQLGLRAESSDYEGELLNLNQKFNNSYPISFFPSMFTSYKLTEKNDVQFSYTRKINRPNFFQLIPFTDYSDSLNLSRGNPELLPEFSNSIELSLQHVFNKQNNLLSSIYLKNTNNLITRYLYSEYDSILNKNVITSTYQNANAAYAYGVEFTMQNTITKWLSLTTNLNIYNSIIDGSNIELNLDNEQFSWFAKSNVSFKFIRNLTIQLSGDYQSRTALQQGSSGGRWGGGASSTAQGYTEAYYELDAALKYDFLKERNASVSINFSDILRSRKVETYSSSQFFKQYSIRRRDPQIVRLNFSYRFGKFDTSLFKRRNNPNNSVEPMPFMDM